MVGILWNKNYPLAPCGLRWRACQCPPAGCAPEGAVPRGASPPLVPSSRLRTGADQGNLKTTTTTKQTNKQNYPLLYKSIYCSNIFILSSFHTQNPILKSHFVLTILFRYAAAAKLRQSCLTLCDPTDGSPPGSSVSGIL